MTDKYLQSRIREGVAAALGTTTLGWQTYTPTVTASASGTLATVTATGQYQELNGMVYGHATITVTDIGTGTGTIKFTLPTNIISTWNHVGTYRESNAVGTLGSLTRSGTNAVTIARYDNTASMASGLIYQCLFMYRKA